MGLSLECQSYVGNQVLVDPYYGYGWNQQVPDYWGVFPDVDVPQPFHMVIDRLLSVGGELRGGLGTVREPGHALDGNRVSFSTRHTGEWNFTDRCGEYNLSVGSVEQLTVDGRFIVTGLPALTGFGNIRDDVA